MKLTPPENPNYAAIVIRVPSLLPLEGLDNLKAVPLFGMQALVSNMQPGSLALLFPAECQLSDEYVRLNDLYRHAEKNSDATKKGYLEDNRRVRAIKFRGHRSDALLMPLWSVDYCFTGGLSTEFLSEGDTFDKLGDYEICRKYINPNHRLPGAKLGSRKREEPRVDAKFFPEHFDTTHWLRMEEHVRSRHVSATPVVITQKLHGTLLRVGHVRVSKKPNFWQRVEQFVTRKRLRLMTYDMVYGSHHVIKDANNPNQQHYYDEDIWTIHGRALDGVLPTDFVVYGELVGFTPSGKPIQPQYTYECLPKQAQFYVYRVAYINTTGLMIDLTWPQVKLFCQSLGLKHVPELLTLPLGSIAPEVLSILTGDEDVKFAELPGTHVFVDKPVRLSNDSPCDEGVCLRIDGLVPEIYKVKNPRFVQLETHLNDKDQSGIDDDFGPIGGDYEPGICVCGHERGEHDGHCTAAGAFRNTRCGCPSFQE